MGGLRRACILGIALALAGAACDHDLPQSAAPATSASPATEDVATVTIRLRATALEGADPGAARGAVADTFAKIGLSIAGDTGARDADVLLTVASVVVAEGSATRRTTLTLSTTVGEHEMEDISGHFVRADGGVDPVTVRELCQRWRRRYQRFQTALSREETAR
jgi:hypothetical protein